MSAMCTGRIECSSESKVQFMYWTLCQVWFKTFYITCTFCIEGGGTTPGWPADSHSLSLPSHESKSTREHLRTGDMAGPTGLGKSKRRYRGNLLKIEWQVGKVSNLDKKAGVSSCHVWNFKWIDAPWKHTCTAKMYNVETCACQRSLRSRISVLDNRVRNKAINNNL